MADYDITAAFEEIENELIDSMMCNFKRHRAEETELGYNWSQWQAEQLKALEQYREQNRKRFGKKFSELNGKVAEMIRTARADGNAAQEVEILQAIKDGLINPKKPSTNSIARFFKVNDRKLDALIKATTDDLSKAEHAVLRMSNDKYRKAIINAQVYANSGSGTYEKAVDMACRDMLRAGLNCVEYKNGARHTLADYADMAIKTANKRAYLQGEGEKRAEWGISTVIINKRQGGCPKCARFIGKVYIDDVWSKGKKSDGKYPLLSSAIAEGLYHPRCKDSHSTYYEGITEVEPVTDEEVEQLEEAEVLEQQQSYYENQAEKNNRIAGYSLDKNNKRIYSARAHAAEEKAEEIQEKIKETIDNSVESGIIKSLDIDDYYLATDGKGISTDVSTVIVGNMKQCERDGGFIISEITAKSIPKTSKGTPVLQIEPLPNGLIQLNLNTDILSGRSLTEIDEIFKNTDTTVVNSLKEAVIHESGHAKTISGKRLLEIEKLYAELEGIHIEGISTIAYNDGAECLAELEVLRSRSIKVPDEIAEFYEKYIGRKYL